MPDQSPDLPGCAIRSVPARGPPGRDILVVGIGASAGGLEAAIALVTALPTDTGLAFVLVQHLNPHQESLLVGLLAGHTAMEVVQADHGMAIEADHLYVIPPGAYLAVGGTALRLSVPDAPHGSRLPVDFLLRSLAEQYGERAIGVVLSGTGRDGTLGLGAIRACGGFTLAQDPEEAAHGGMPRSAIAAGVVDQVLPVASIARALAAHARKRPTGPVPGPAAGPVRDATTPREGGVQDGGGQGLDAILALVGARSARDFTQYKLGTLRRRTERRMAMLSIPAGEMGRYLAVLRGDTAELDRLGHDLLINVTRFFRDPEVFAQLAESTIPALLRERASGQPLRVWVPGCSTGEEAYSIAILLREAIAALSDPEAQAVRVQVFASDADAHAVAAGREGRYPESIGEDVSPARLARFFEREDHGLRVGAELRAAVVFTVQDVLADPPFSRLDLVSCRNLLIYLDAQAQAKVLSRFAFALREGGALLLGGAETAGAAGRFEAVPGPARLYRATGGGAGGDGAYGSGADGFRLPVRSGRAGGMSRQGMLAGLCARFVMAAHAPATILTNARHEYLYSAGPTDRYLRVAPGQPTQDLLAMVREDTRTRLRTAIAQAAQEGARVVAPGGRSLRDGHATSFRIEVQPVSHEGEALLLVCLVDEPGRPAGRAAGGAQAGERAEVAGLERELEAARTELQGAARDLELSSQEQRAINEEALSVNEEIQSTNEELLTSKEELQSLNEELSALNSQLQATLEQQRTTSDDLQNVLYSTDVATLFLDTALRIRFFTPATRSLFAILPGDIGRPLADLHSLAGDGLLADDARAVLAGAQPVEREIEAPGGAWFRRRVLPYRTHDDRVEGVVITFNDITRRRQAAEAIEAARGQAERASTAKSRFLAAASHDLRQPLQTMALLQGLLAGSAGDGATRGLVTRLGDSLDAMSGMLDTLLDINQIEAGIVRAEPSTFPIGALLDRLRRDFATPAQAQSVRLRVAGCSVQVRSDPRLLEQMLRNLLSNALKYTRRGTVLLGCRRRGAVLSVEVWDTGIGIAHADLATIFEEYHQLGNDARERGRGLGLGLSIVQRLGALLGHAVRVRSWPGRGSVFSIDVALPSGDLAPGDAGPPAAARPAAPRAAAILLVEDDAEVRALLELALARDGHRVLAAADGRAALALVAEGAPRPDLLLTDQNLPGMDGLELAASLRAALGVRVPAIVLTGDISAPTLRAIAGQDCLHLAKPVGMAELARVIAALLPPNAGPPPPAAIPPAALMAARTGGAGSLASHVIALVDDDASVRDAIRSVLEAAGAGVEAFASAEAFLAADRPAGCCLLVDATMPGMGGLALLRRLQAEGHARPAIMITGYGDVATAVAAMKAGALDFIEKPVDAADLVARIARVLEHAQDSAKLSEWREAAARSIAGLTARQREIMDLVLAGQPSKNIAADLAISRRTVENHRASIMRRTGAGSLPALARLALAAGDDAGTSPRPEG